MSQTDLAKPQRQRTIHFREWASMLWLQLRGRIRTKNLWMGDITDSEFGWPEMLFDHSAFAEHPDILLPLFQRRTLPSGLVLS